MAHFAASCPVCASAVHSGQAGHENVLLGMHFLHANTDCNARGSDPVDIAASFWDYVRHMPEDLAHMSYADFWHWWYEFERYKGDEKGLAEFDRIVDECLARGMKVKVDLAWTTWWTEDRDWQENPNMAAGPVDVDDWVHLCDLLARRYKGRVALWMLQGEANDLKNYWQGAPIEHVQKIYAMGSSAFKRIDPDVMISIAGASPSVPREALDEWVRSNTAACKGLFDDVPMNYFGDVADPYKGLLNYYQSIRGILDTIGERDVEIGSGESSFQWAESSYDLPKDPPKSMAGLDMDTAPLSELKQAWRCNESLGTFFDTGGSKFVLWGTEYAPGGGWAWRWGFRKYQDWWGVWPDTHRIPGANIVYRYDNPDGRKVDLRPGWTSRESDPYHPMWQVYKFWAQATPPGAEAIRLPSSLAGNGPRVLSLATYLRTQDRCVLLLQNDEERAVSIRIDVGRTCWADGTPVEMLLRNEAIDYATGDVTPGKGKTITAEVRDAGVELSLPPVKGFTTIRIDRRHPEMAAELIDVIVPHEVEVGKPIECAVAVRNTGRSPWAGGRTRLALEDPHATNKAEWRVCSEVKPDEQACFVVNLAALNAPGRFSRFLRMKDGEGNWFGPSFCVAANVVEMDSPRKLVALRELGHVRLRWFAPLRADEVEKYVIERAPGFGEPFGPIATLSATEYVDSKVEPDKVYYYRVVAVGRGGKNSRPSNEDNASAISSPRIWDAEIVSHTVPEAMALGDSRMVSITIRNTGTKPWAADSSETRVFLASTDQWGQQDEDKLPRISPNVAGPVESGESVTVQVPYSGYREGRFENHWVMAIESPGRQRVYFGSPLLVETEIGAR